MLLESYNEQGLLSVTTVLGATSETDKFAFRGDLVLKEGELREGSDRDRKPPELLLQQAAILAGQDEIIFINGLLKELQSLPIFVEKYKEALSSNTLAILYIENIEDNMLVELEGTSFQLMPYSGGMVWNEFLDALYLEKADLKGQSAEDKVITVYESAKDYDGKAAKISFDEALTKTFVVEKELSGGPV